MRLDQQKLQLTFAGENMWQQPVVKQPRTIGPVGAIMIMATIIVLLVGGIFIVKKIINKDSPSAAEVGNCINMISAETLKAEAELADCSAPEATYKVAIKQDSSLADCAEGDYAEYSESGRKSDGFRLCLMLNAAVGDCFKSEGNIYLPGKTTKISCGSSASFRVTEIKTGVTDKSLCEDIVYVYSEPATTLCAAKL